MGGKMKQLIQRIKITKIWDKVKDNLTVLDLYSIKRTVKTENEKKCRKTS